MCVAIESLTKSEEKELFSKIVAKCPEGYVKDILQSIAIDVNRAIDSDFGCISKNFGEEISDLHAERDELSNRVQSLREQSEKLQTEFRRAQRTIQDAGELRKQLQQTIAAIRSL